MRSFRAPNSRKRLIVSGASSVAIRRTRTRFLRMIVSPGTRFESDVPARLDRLPWSPWHWRVVIALGITWMLDGLEGTLVGAIGPVLMRPDTLRLTSTQLGGTATAYLAGAVLGALLFGRLTDLFG